MNKPRLLFLTVSDRNGASGRYRVYQFAPILEEAGFLLDIRPPAPMGSGLARVVGRRREEKEFLEAAGTADLVFVQKRLFSAGFFRRLAKIGVSIVFDFDDAIFTSANARSSSTQRRVERRLHAILRSTSLVIAGNPYLAEYAARFVERVEVLPTAVDVSKYGQKTHQASKRITLGWIGSRVTQPYLEAISNVFARLPEAAPEIEFRLIVVSNQPFAAEGVAVDDRQWSEDREVDDILEMDIGLMPLDDSDWTRGKCGLKALQYLAAGVPAICSPVGVNREIVDDGRNGFLCATEDEWVDRIVRLARDAEMRVAFGDAGRKRVTEGFSTERVGERMTEVLRECLGAGV